jgi:4'-phosphopantetheinyl transferase EntD
VVELKTPAGLIVGLFPDDVAVVEMFGDPDHVDLYPAEAEAVARSTENRRREYGTVRLCARSALSLLGVPGVAIPPMKGVGPPWATRAPRWPPGIVGSMTHCDGFRAAAVARHETVASVGVDAEPNLPLPAGVLDYVTNRKERSALAELAADRPETAWDRVLFSAKESIFKAWFPLTGRWLDFTDCAMTIDPHSGTFVGELLLEGPVVDGHRISRFAGQWRTVTTSGSGFLATAVHLERSAEVRT